MVDHWQMALIDDLLSSDRASRRAAWNDLSAGADMELAARLAAGGRADRKSEAGHATPTVAASPFSVEVASEKGQAQWLTLAGMSVVGELDEVESLAIEEVEWDYEDYPTPTERAWLCGFRDAWPLGGLPRLRSVTFSNCAIESLDGLADCPELRELAVGSPSSDIDISALSGARQPRILRLRGLHGELDLSPLAPLTELRVLDLSACRSLQDIQPLSAMVGLQGLDLGQTSVSDLSALTPLVQLRSLNLNHCGRIDSLAPLGRLPALERLTMYFVGGVVPPELIDRSDAGLLDYWHS